MLAANATLTSLNLSGTRLTTEVLSMAVQPLQGSDDGG
jgi:hypothetical protein